MTTPSSSHTLDPLTLGREGDSSYAGVAEESQQAKKVTLQPLRQTFSSSQRLAADFDLPRQLFLPGTNDPRPQESHFTDPSSAWKQGVDLFNHGFFWEAHEAWEFAWLQYPRLSSEGLFIRGCIQTAAALVKLRLHHVGGVQKLSCRSLATLKQSEAGKLFGVHREKFQAELVRFWACLRDDKLPRLDDFPRIEVEES